MGNFTPITKDLISIGSVETGQMVDIADNITSMSLSLTMDQASELTFSVIDPGFAFASSNYFQIRRDVFYRELIFEIARVEVSRSDSIHPEYRLVCYNKNVQMMKRDKKPEAYRGISASDYVRTIAKRFNMKTFIQETQKKQSIVKGRSNSSDENVWSVLQRSAQEAEFACFEIDNCLFFCSQKYLLGKWGDPDYQYMGNFFVPFGWPENDDTAFPGSKNKYILMDMPTFTRSENDPMDAEGTLLVERTNGVQLRPGMTVNITGIPDFENGYLVTDVSFDEGVNDPVSVSFRTPVKPGSGQKGKSGVSNNGNKGGAPNLQSENLREISAQLDPVIISQIQDYVKSNFSGAATREAERNVLIQQQTAAAVTAAARVYSLPTLDQRRNALIEQYQLLGAKNYQTALQALALLEGKLLAGPPSPRQGSGFPSEGILNAQFSLGAGLAVSGFIDPTVPAVRPGVPQTPVTGQPSVVVRNVNPPIAGALPRSVEAKVRTLVQQRTFNRFEQDRIINAVLGSARRIYNLTFIDNKRRVFDEFIRNNRNDPIATAAMRAIRVDLIVEPPESLLGAGTFSVMTGSSVTP
jgi:hypothetical protein